MISRRHFLFLSAIATQARAQLDPNIAAKRKAALDEAIHAVTRGVQPKPGRVKLDVPPLVDNGNTVPISVTVDSPMTAADHVRVITVLTEKNPQPYVLSAHLGPRAGRASVSVRGRIADTGNVIAIAEMSDGSFWSDTVSVVVTLSACLEDGLI
jgi:sulfur-oxidizing protein SoxY